MTMASDWESQKLVSTSKSDKAQVKFVSQGNADPWHEQNKARIQATTQPSSESFSNLQPQVLPIFKQYHTRFSSKDIYKHYGYRQDDETYPWGHRQESAFWTVSSPAGPRWQLPGSTEQGTPSSRPFRSQRYSGEEITEREIVGSRNYLREILWGGN